MALMAAAALTKIYWMGHQEIRAVDNITVSFEAGEFVAIMGRSGSGKSTLLNLLGGLDRPTKGQVIIAGVDLTRLGDSALPKLRREKIGFVFQHFNLIPTLTALENVILPLRYARVEGRHQQEMAYSALAQVGLSPRMNHRPSELSGGEQQRAAIARALVNHPAIVLADEPTGELDTHTALEIVGLIKELNQEHGQLFIIVTHDPLVANEAKRIIRLQDGRIESDTLNGTPSGGPAIVTGADG